MLFPQLDLRHFARLASALIPLAILAGCGQRDEIIRYTVPKPELVDPSLRQASTTPTAGNPQQTLGAIILAEDTGWFFKLIGDPSLVQPQRERFVEFVKSVRFSEEAEPKPSWTLPEGWTQLPGERMRYATVQVSADGQTLDLSVIPLPKRDEQALDEYVLANVNRWRGEVGLPPIDAAELSSETEKLKAGGREVTLVDVSGTSQTGGGMAGMMAGPFAGGASPPNSSPATGSASAAPPAESPIDYEAPPEWNAGKINQFRKAAFEVTDGDQQVEITVIDLQQGSGTLLQNINRWRDEVGLPHIAENDLAAETTKIATLGTEGDYVVLAGPESAAGRQTTLGVVAPAADQVWFIKLRGDHDLAMREKERFEAFVKSLKLKTKAQ